MSQENQPQTTTRELTADQVMDSVKNDKNTPEDIAAAFFTLEYPKFKALLNVLSMNELIRLCLNMAGKEFVPDANKLKSDNEKSAFYLADQMIFNRSIMLLSYEMQKAEQAQKLLDSNDNNTEIKTVDNDQQKGEQ